MPEEKRQKEPDNGFSKKERDAVYRIIKARRDIRGNRFLSKPVTDETLARILEAAHHAPSVGYMQPWNFIIIKDLEVKEKVKKIFEKANEYSKSLFDEQKKALYSSLRLEGIIEAPVNLCVTSDTTRGGDVVLGRTTIMETDAYSTVCAVQNLWLAARAEGVGVGWVSILFQEKLKKVLQIPDKVIPVAYLCLGYVKDFPEKPELEEAGWGKRLSLEELCFQETWGKTWPGLKP